MDQIRLAIAGLGNCASALVQGTQFYAKNPPKGLVNTSIGGYHVPDITPVCGFDVDERKVGKTVGEAVQVESNCTTQFVSMMEELSAPVYMGPQKDGVAEHMADKSGFSPGKQDPVNVTERLRQHNVDVLVNYLPVGSTSATETYAEACLETGVAFVNAIPVFIASDPTWGQRFEKAGIPTVGDDIKSQIGATITHRKLIELLEERGGELINTYQLNYGGNTDFKNMLAESRLADKRESKKGAVNSLLSNPLQDEHIRIGPSDYIEWMDDTKKADIKLEGEMFGGVEFELSVELTVEDSPNSAGSAVDAIRVAKVALDRDVAGPIESVSAMTMKHPPTEMTDSRARKKTREFLEENTSKTQ